GRVQAPVAAEPDQRDPAVAGGQRLDRADVRAAAAAQDDRPLREVDRHGQRLLVEALLLADRSLGEGQRQPRGFGHRLAAFAPGLRDPNHARAVLAAAGVALVARPDRDRGEGAAVRAAGAQAAHSVFSYVSLRRTWRMPAFSYRRTAPVVFSPSTPSPTRVAPRCSKSRKE